MDPYEEAAREMGWQLNADGAFRHENEVLDDGSPASFWYEGDWARLCAEANIDVVED